MLSVRMAGDAVVPWRLRRSTNQHAHVLLLEGSGDDQRRACIAQLVCHELPMQLIVGAACARGIINCATMQSHPACLWGSTQTVPVAWWWDASYNWPITHGDLVPTLATAQIHRDTVPTRDLKTHKAESPDHWPACSVPASPVECGVGMGRAGSRLGPAAGRASAAAWTHGPRDTRATVRHPDHALSGAHWPKPGFASGS